MLNKFLHELYQIYNNYTILYDACMNVTDLNTCSDVTDMVSIQNVQTSTKQMITNVTTYHATIKLR